jgi:hypothetical protein
MLFARFLAENRLLIEPVNRVPISTEDCIALAQERGEDPWTYAASLAQAMLPEIFRPGDPTLAVALPPEARQELERLVRDLPDEVFRADDSLGWTYQFWQAERKKEVNESEVPVGADEIAAVTQLFTEHYMVEFLLHNTIGAWHAGKVLATKPDMLRDAASEAALRAAVAIPGCGFEYLRFVREGEKQDGPWVVGAGTYPTWPQAARELTVLDPCCGSGHFLVAVFDLLVRLRMHEEGLALPAAIGAVLRENLFGLELDPRCTQIAAFAVALHAWKWLETPAPLPRLHIACSGLAVGRPRKEWCDLGGSSERMREGMGALHDLFESAPVLGSLLDPQRMAEGTLLVAGPGDLGQPLASALTVATTEEAAQAGVAARGMLDAIALLNRRFDFVATNPPYLLRRKQSVELQAHCRALHPDAANDLAFAMLSRFLRIAHVGGTVAVVLPQTWTFLTTDMRFRKRMLRESVWNVAASLGSRAFQTITGEVVNVGLYVFSVGTPSDTSRMARIDASGGPSHIEKAEALHSSPAIVALQADTLAAPNSRLLFVERGSGDSLEVRAASLQGVSTGDDPCFLRLRWEMDRTAHAMGPLARQRSRDISVFWQRSSPGPERGGGRYCLCSGAFRLGAGRRTCESDGQPRCHTVPGGPL